MTQNTVSKNIELIKDIDADSRELWLVLSSNADHLKEASIKALFINILHKDSENQTRFDLKRSEKHIERAVRDHKDTISGQSSSTNILQVCYRITSKDGMQDFLFNPNH